MQGVEPSSLAPLLMQKLEYAAKNLRLRLRVLGFEGFRA